MPSIGELCRDPVETRARAAAGEPVPCFRCLAWTGSKCKLLDAERWPADRHRPAKEPEQTTLFKEKP